MFPQAKDQFDQKQKWFEKCRDHLLLAIEIGEDHAFFCEIPGWNNQNYLDAVAAMRAAQPSISVPMVMGHGGAAALPGGAVRRSHVAARLPPTEMKSDSE
jgi:hypothetical protein